jgi:hypothetical protein
VLGFVAFLYFFALSLGPLIYPHPGLDSSWTLALTEAARAHLTFGRDIDFTYGPLGYLTTGAATPEAFHSIAWARIGLSGILAALVIFSTLGPWPMYRKIAFLIAMAVAIPNVVLPFPAILVISVCLFSADAKRLATRAAILGTLAGVFSLTKFENAVDFALGIGGALAVACLLDRSPSGARHERVAALAAFLSSFFATSAIAFASLSYGAVVATTAYIVCVACLTYAVLALDFQVWNLRYARPALGLAGVLSIALLCPSGYRQFLATSLQFALGYSSAMVTEGAPYDVTLGLLLLALVAVVALTNRAVLGWGVVFGVFVVAWLSFKEGFVRQDGHVLAFYTSACLILAVFVRYTRSTSAFVAACFAFSASVMALAQSWTIFIPGAVLADDLSPQAFLAKTHQIADAFGPAPGQSIVSLALAPDAFEATVRARIATMPVDVQPAETDVIFANGFRWAPEPVFQSYSAYTPALDRIDADSLRSEPRRVLYAYGSIDGREPFAESPLAHRTLLCNYHLDPGFAGNSVSTADGIGYVVLTPSSERCSTPIAGAPLRVGWNVAVATPRTQPGEFILASIRPRLTPAGTLVRALFRAPPVYVTFSRAGGGTRLRILPDQAPNGVLVDPLPTDNATYAALESGKLLPSTTSLTLSSDDAGAYAPEIDVTFLHVRYHD